LPPIDDKTKTNEEKSNLIWVSKDLDMILQKGKYKNKDHFKLVQSR
jgi:hypothetical protein